MMRPERLQELLEIYGSDEERWPDSERFSMRVCLDEFQVTPQALLDAQDLDLMLDSYVPAATDLEQRIFDALPRSVIDRFVEWLFPELPRLWWRPAFAASLPLALGLVLGMEPVGVGLADSSANWEIQERNLLLPDIGADWYE